VTMGALRKLSAGFLLHGISGTVARSCAGLCVCAQIRGGVQRKFRRRVTEGQIEAGRWQLVTAVCAWRLLVRDRGDFAA
jgi:hypothetical protein